MSFINMDKRFKISKMLIDNYILLILVLVVTTHKGSDAFGFDSATSCSPNGKLSRRGRAQMLAAIPCDLTRQPYCNLPGAAYPWHAVRRFVHENQGLMKRMYGDVRHISVLRDEIRNNEIDMEDIEMAAERYSSKPSDRRSAKYMHPRGEDFTVGAGIRNNDIVMEPHFRPVSSTTTHKTLSVDDSDLEGSTTQSTKIESTTVVVTKDEKNTLKNSLESPKEDVEATFKPNNKLSDSTMNNEHENDDGNLASNSVYELPTFSPNQLIPESASGDNIKIIESPKLNVDLKNNTEKTLTESKGNRTSIITPESTSTSTTTTTKTPIRLQTTTSMSPTTKRSTTTSYIDVYRRRPQYTNRYRPSQTQQKLQQQQQLHKVNTTIFPSKDKTLSTQTKKTTNESEGISRTTTTRTTTVEDSTTLKPLHPISTTLKQTNSNSSFISATLKINATNKNDPSMQHNTPTEKTTLTLATQSATPLTSSLAATFPYLKPKIELLSGEKLRKQPTTVANKYTTSTATSSGPSTKPPVLRDGQLYQDTIKQEPTPVANLRGINACPVKEEVVAPFWANNTRGEVLALLNLYPFEQYVHWEKCTHEHKQMYCREGCRCEQQYRLHRLLAYDPHNECRGIFSDWFRFPSCCICKCYNIPMDFRATSRSPRMENYPPNEDNINISEDHRHPLEVAEEEVKRAIYEHATEDWYRPSDEYDYGDY